MNRLLGIIRNVSFGLKESVVALTFEVCALDVRPMPFTFVGAELENLLTKWNVRDIKGLEKMPVVVIVTPPDDSGNQRVMLDSLFLV